MTNRKIKEAGMNPFVGYVLGLLAFVLVAEFIFQMTEFAKYLVLLSAFSFLFKLSEKNRADFLLAAFGDSKKRSLRMIENVFVSIPFIAILIVKNATLESSLLLVGAIVLASFSFKTDFHIFLPTPFSNHPFEFTVGFRRSFFIFPIAYTLTIIAISVDNLNLGVFAMLLVYLTALSYYAKPENEFYVWVHADTPKSFIYKKLKVAARNVFILNLPIFMSLLIFYPNEFSLIILFYFIGQFFLWTLILAKYSAYPQEISLPEGFLLAFSIYFPPLLIALMPFFYSKSINKLKMILYDKN